MEKTDPLLILIYFGHDNSVPPLMTALPSLPASFSLFLFFFFRLLQLFHLSLSPLLYEVQLPKVIYTGF